MSTAFFLLLIVLIPAAEIILPRWMVKQTSIRCTCDTELAEPGQEITVTAEVNNYSLLPVPFLRLRLYFPEDAEIPGRKQGTWYRKNQVERILFLMPRQRRTVHFPVIFQQRGKHGLGKYYLEVGDFLGLHGKVRSDDLTQKIVVMPRRWEDPQSFSALGGYLGDISVRRFMMEDPILTVGFREYTGREPMKSIAWNQSARSGKLMVNQYDHTVEANATVVLSLDGGTREDREMCLRIARTVCEELEKKRIPYDFFSNGDLEIRGEFLSWLAKGLGQQHCRTILYGLGTAACRCCFPLSQLVEHCSAGKRTSVGYILITPPMNARQRSSAEYLRARSGSDICILEGRAQKEDAQ